MITLIICISKFETISPYISVPVVNFEGEERSEEVKVTAVYYYIDIIITREDTKRL